MFQCQVLTYLVVFSLHKWSIEGLMINGLGCWILEVLTILFFQLICWLQLLLLCNPWFNCLMGNQPKLLTLALLFFLLHSLSLMFFVFLPLALTCYMLVLSHYLNLIVLFSSPLIVLSRTFYLGKRLGWARLLMACTCCSVIVSNTFLLLHLLITWSIISSMLHFFLSLQ